MSVVLRFLKVRSIWFITAGMLLLGSGTGCGMEAPTWDEEAASIRGAAFAEDASADSGTDLADLDLPGDVDMVDGQLVYAEDVNGDGDYDVYVKWFCHETYHLMYKSSEGGWKAWYLQDQIFVGDLNGHGLNYAQKEEEEMTREILVRPEVPGNGIEKEDLEWFYSESSVGVDVSALQPLTEASGYQKPAE